MASRRSARILLLASITSAVAVTSCGRNPDRLSTSQAPTSSAPVAPPEDAPKAGIFTYATNGKVLAVAGGTKRLAGFDGSWIGIFDPADPRIELAPPIPLKVPLAGIALQFVGDHLVVVGNECPAPPKGEEVVACGDGKLVALELDLLAKRWSALNAPPLPPADIEPIGPINGRAAFGVLAPSATSTATRFVGYTLESDGTWKAIPPPPIANVGALCNSSGAATVVESGLVPVQDVGSKGNGEAATSDGPGGELSASWLDGKSGEWRQTVVAKADVFGATTCGSGGLVLQTGASSATVAQPASGSSTQIEADGPILPPVLASAGAGGDTLVTFDQGPDMSTDSASAKDTRSMALVLADGLAARGPATSLGEGATAYVAVLKGDVYRVARTGTSIVIEKVEV